MLSQNSRLRAMKSLLYSYYLDFRSFYGIYVGIMAGLIISKFLITPSASGSSALNAGLVNCIFLLFIAIIIITSNTELLKKFSFPVDRDLIVLSHIICILVLPAIMLLTSCVFFLLETAAAELTLVTSGNFFYSWIITKSSFLTGFAVSYIAIVCLTSMAWMFFAWFYRHKIIVSVIGGTFILALIYLDDFREGFSSLVVQIFHNVTPGLLFLRLAAVTLVSFALGYIPIKRMEVK